MSFYIDGFDFAIILGLYVNIYAYFLYNLFRNRGVQTKFIQF